MWNKMNSPIVIATLAIASLFVLRLTWKPRLASEIRGAYQELMHILEESASDMEKNEAIRRFVQEMAAQAREGFAQGFGQDKNEDKVYLDTRSNIQIKGLKFVKSQWPNREKLIFVVANKSDKYIGTLRLSYEFYREGTLIDCDDEWISQVKILEPGQEVAISGNRSLPKDQAADHTSDEVRVKVISFDIKHVQ